MTKREFLGTAMASLAGATLAGAPATAAQDQKPGNIVDDGVTFQWRHRAGRLHATLAAPTTGWIAAGFNESRSLVNTRFVIAAVSKTPIRVEEHIALVPDHKEVGRLGLPRVIADVSGYTESGISHLAFSWPHTFLERPSLSLSPGSEVRVMLAWSHERDFYHHSAWRRHFDITL